jgi:hypothetical protein
LQIALKRIEIKKIPFPNNEDNQLPGNIGTGISIEAIVKIEKKAIINNPFKFIPSLIT